MKTTLLIVRHGQTNLNAQHRMDGQADTSLTQIGLDQIEKLSLFLSKYKIDCIYSSPLSRSSKTAEAIIKRQNTPLSVNKINNFREIDCGDCTGLTHDEVIQKFPQLSMEWGKNTDPPFPNGESLRDVEARAIPIIEQILSVDAGKTILISGHGSLNVAIIGHYLQMPPAIRFKLRQDNCCLNILEFNDKKELVFVRGINISSRE
jgi:hypothetical protein